ncbi:protein kinase domain-containing protein [Marinobacterium sedimentorum]|uniref:protein kinase domain-containing protein n=1 Tax=Marinobacterium sedimentorum TaxID=2927804 RepID=UPI0020C640BE|nr:protein kinase [Marinobacterium sedimentorum]MCP8687137.1 protein kinase [Marinobacterium sedimentorum]
MDIDNAKKREVKDVFGHAYVLTEKLGEGGQGVVWKTDTPKVLIKGFTNKDPDLRKVWVDQISWLMRQDLTDLHIARPVALLQEPRAGYVMELMDGLIPLTELLEKFVEEGVEGYLVTGGLSRRLQLLKKLASTLAIMHGRGMLFGDLSPDNIYISSDVEHAETWLIDCDNISFESRPCRALYTPDYGAPELVNGKAEFSTLTDIWSFAVIAYRLLTGNHPFKGDMVNYGEPELEEQALRGELPWIEHAEDRSNACEFGIPLDGVVTGKLRQLFYQCFNAGLSDPLERPSMASWLEALHETSERVVHCQGCTSSYLLNKEISCPFCNESLEAGFVLLSEYHYIPPAHLPNWNDNDVSDSWLRTGRVIVVQEGNEVAIRRDVPSLWNGLSISNSAHVKFTSEGLEIDPLESQLSLQRETKVVSVPKRMKLRADLRGKTDAWYFMHIGDIGSSHSVWRFKW